MGAKLSQGDVGKRPISHVAFTDAILGALSSEFMFDSLHQRGAIPDPDVAALRVLEEICASLERAIKREHFDLSIRRNVPYSQLGLADRSASRTIRPRASLEPAASLVTFDSTGQPVHVLEVVGRWEHAACLELVRRLARLPRANGISDTMPTTVRWAGLACYHTHCGDLHELPWFDLDGRPALSDEIEAAVEREFERESAASELGIAANVETFAFDRWGKPPYGNGSVTAALIEFNGFSENSTPSPG